MIKTILTGVITNFVYEVLKTKSKVFTESEVIRKIRIKNNLKWSDFQKDFSGAYLTAIQNFINLHEGDITIQRKAHLFAPIEVQEAFREYFIFGEFEDQAEGVNDTYDDLVRCLDKNLHIGDDKLRLELKTQGVQTNDIIDILPQFTKLFKEAARKNINAVESSILSKMSRVGRDVEKVLHILDTREDLLMEYKSFNSHNSTILKGYRQAQKNQRKKDKFISTVKELGEAQGDFLERLVHALEIGAGNAVSQLNFIEKRAGDLNENDLLTQTRVHYYQDYYLNRPALDDELLSLAQEQVSSVIVGNSNTGKSRAILELLRQHFQDSPVYLVQKQHIDDVTEKPSFEETIRLLDHLPASDHTVFFVFNDLEDFASVWDLDKIISKILAVNNYVILATCKRAAYSDLYDQLSLQIDDEPGGRLSKLDVLPLNNEEKQILNEQFPDQNNLEVDDTIGSYLMGLKLKRDEYTQFGEGSLEQEILWAIKCTSFYFQDSAGKEETIREYVEMRMKNYYNQKELFTPSQWEDSLIKLFKMGFIYKAEEINFKKEVHVHIKLEEVYMDRIVVPKRISELADGKTEEELEKEMEKFICDDILKTYRNTDPEKRKNIFYKVFVGGKSNEQRHYLLDLMEKESIEVESIIMNIFIRKAETKEKAETYYQELLERQLQPDSFTLNGLIKFESDYYKARMRCYEFESMGLELGEHTYRSLLYQASNFYEAWECYEGIRKYAQLTENFGISEYFFYGMMKKAKTFEQSYDIYEAMTEAQLEVNAKFYESMIMKPGGSFEKAWEMYQELKPLSEKNPMNPVVLAKLIEKATDFKDALTAYSEIGHIKFSRKSLPPHVFNSMIKKSRNFEEAYRFFCEMSEYGTEPKTETHNLLMRFAPDLEECTKLKDKMIDEGIPVDSHTYYNLILHTPESDVETALKYYEQYNEYDHC